MTITKKETKKKTAASSSSSTKVSKSSVSELNRSSSGVEIQDISDNTGTVVTYKLDENGGKTGGVETITTYHKVDSGDTIAQTVSYPAVDTSSQYMQYVSNEGASSSHTSSSVVNKSSSSNIQDSLNTTYTVTEPREDVKITTKEGDSAWNGKFIYEKPLQTKIIKPIDGNTIVECSSTSSASKKSSSVQKSSSSSYVIEIVDGKERIIDSKHHGSEFKQATGSDEHSSARYGTHIAPEAHYVQKLTDSSSAYDSAVPELAKPKTQSSELMQEIHMVDGQTSSSVSHVTNVADKTIKTDNLHAIRENTGKLDKNKISTDQTSIINQENVFHTTTGASNVVQSLQVISNVQETHSSDTKHERVSTDNRWDGKFVQDDKRTKIDSGSHTTSSKQIVDDKLTNSKMKSSQDFISREIISEGKNVDSKIEQTSDTMQEKIHTDNKIQSGDDVITQKMRTDTNWDGTFVYEKNDNLKKKHTTTDSSNFYGNTGADYASHTKSTFVDKGHVQTTPMRHAEDNTSGDFYDTSSSRAVESKPDRVIYYEQPSTVQSTQKTQTTSSGDFYGRSSGVRDNVVVKNVYDTTSTQNVIGGKSTTLQHEVIYDSSGKVITDTSDIIFSNDRNYGKSGWNGKFTYEKPYEEPKREIDSPIRTTPKTSTKLTTEDKKTVSSTDEKITRMSDKKTQDATSKDFYGTSSTEFHPDRVIYYEQPATAQNVQKTQGTTSRDFYGHSSGVSDNVVVKNVYDTTSTQNVIGGKTTTSKHDVIYDSSGKIITDTSDIIFSNDRNYGKTGWNGRFTYEKPYEEPKKGQDSPIKTDISSKLTKDGRQTVTSVDEKITNISTTQGHKGEEPLTKHPKGLSSLPKDVNGTKSTDLKNSETIQTIKYDSTGKVISDTSDVIYTYDTNKSGWNGKFIYETPQKGQKPTDSWGGPKDGSKPRDHSQKKPENGHTQIISSDTFETVSKTSSTDVKSSSFRDSKTFIDDKTVVESYTIVDGQPRLTRGPDQPIDRKPDDRIITRGQKGPITEKYETSSTFTNKDVRVSKDSKTYVDNKEIVESFIISETGQPERPERPERRRQPSPGKQISPYEKSPKEVSKIYDSSTVDIKTSSDIKSSVYRDTKAYVDSKTTVEHYIITEDGRRVLVDSKEQNSRKDVTRDEKFKHRDTFQDSLRKPGDKPRDRSSPSPTRGGPRDGSRESPSRRPSDSPKSPKGPQDRRSPKRGEIVPRGDYTDAITTTENYEVTQNFSNTDIKRTVFEDVRSETYVDNKTFIDNRSYTDVKDIRDTRTDKTTDIRKHTDVVDRSVSKTFIDEKSVTDIRRVSL